LAVFKRSGEGTPVSTEVKRIVGVDGKVSTAIGFSVNEAPVPEREYLAHVVGFEPSSGGYRFLFGQERIGGEGLRSMVIIDLSTEATERFVRSAHGMPRPADTADGVNAPKKFTEEPAQTVEMAANVVAVATSDGECTMDFLHASPFVFHALNEGRATQVQLNAVVRINVRSGLFFGLVHALEARGLGRGTTPGEEIEHAGI
jgi:hypothetical protein